jgi:hypothetical protein
VVVVARGGVVVMASVGSAEEWDTHYYRIFSDLCADGEPETFAGLVAERECVEQFGERPEQETKQ